MKKITCKSGEYSQIKLLDSSIFFISVLPHCIKVQKLFFNLIPIKTIWYFEFPFYIRKPDEVWVTSKVILDIVIETIKNVKNYAEMVNVLKSTTDLALQEYIKEYSEETLEISIDRVGYLIQEELTKSNFKKYQPIVSAFGLIIEKTSKEAIDKYPALVYPESLLPYPKEKIKEALFNIRYCITDEDRINAVEIGLLSLEDFIDDNEANKRNEEMIQIMTMAKPLFE